MEMEGSDCLLRGCCQDGRWYQCVFLGLVRNAKQYDSCLCYDGMISTHSRSRGLEISLHSSLHPVETSRATHVRVNATFTWLPQSALAMREPVARLQLSLYGHPQFGAFWQQHFEERIFKQGFSKVEGWPSVDRSKKTGVCLTVYVDDILALGTPDQHNATLQDLRSTVVMDDTKPIQKFLGCNHAISRKVIGGNVQTSVEFDMADYMKIALKMFSG